MADRFWVGGTDSWNGTAGTKWAATSGGAGGESVPTTADDVFFDANSSGTVTIAAGNTGAKSINCTGFTGGIAGSAVITVAGSITLDAGMTYTHTGNVTITGTGTLTTAGKTFSAVFIDAAGITVTLGDALNTGFRLVSVLRGTFDTANYSLSSNALSSQGVNARTVNLGSSTVTLVGTFVGAIAFNNPSLLTFNAGTSQINITSGGIFFAGAGKTFHNVSFTSTAAGTRSITDANTFNDLTLNASATGLSQLQLSADQTVNGTFTCAGSSAIARGFVRSDVIGTTRTITAAAVSATDCDFRDITIAGAAAPISPTRAGDCGGNSGITFPAAKTVFRVGTNTIWQGINSWALTSGGTGSDDNFPLAQDTAVIDDNTTLTGTISLTIYNIGSLDCSARTTGITLNHNTQADRYGDYTLGSGVTISGPSTQTFSGRGTQTFTSAGKTITFTIFVNKPTGAFELGDAFVLSNSVTLVQGTFDAKNYNVTCTFFASNNSNTRTITMGSGLWTLSGTGGVWNTGTTSNLTFNKDTADILLSNTTTTARTFTGGGLSYNKVTIGGGAATSQTTFNSANNNFFEVASTKTGAHTITFSSTPMTIGTWSVTGTSGNVVTVNSNIAGTRRTINLTNATSDIDFLDVKDIGITDPDKFYVGDNSTDSGNNLNVIFTAAPGGAVDLTGDGITAGAPTLETAVIVQGHNLAADSLTTGPPVIQSSTVVQGHILAANGITTGQPVVGQATASEVINLLADGITTGAPVLGQPAVIEQQVINPSPITTGQPVVGASIITQQHVLAANDITTGQPVVEAAALNSAFIISLAAITTGQPVVGSSALVQQHALTTTNITTAPPTVGSADILHVLLAAANVSASASVTASALRVQFAQSGIAGILTTTALPVASYVTAPQIACAATTTANVNRIQFTSAATSISAIFTASARLKWEPEPDTPETWTDIPVASGIWTEVA
jgi:hypothetical protein